LWLTLRAVTCPLVGEYVAFQPEAMVCPLGILKTSDQPFTVELPMSFPGVDGVGDPAGRRAEVAARRPAAGRCPAVGRTVIPRRRPVCASVM
jgi:hypothetical protein